MKIQSFVQKHAKNYHELPFEMKLLLGIAVYGLTLMAKIEQGGRGGIRFLKTLGHHIQRARAAMQKRNDLSRKKRHLPKQRGFRFGVRTKLKYAALGSFLSFIFIFLPLLMLIFLQDLPNPTELTERQIPQTTKIYDRNGILLTEIYASQNRTLVSLDSVPKYLQEATLAIEDKNFYHHPGFDLASIIRAAKEDIVGKRLQGGSTITQQLIKSTMLTPEQHVSRKIKEIVLAFWAERIYTKQQILEMYFNQVPYGGTAWGVEAASEVYFDKSVKQLDLAESAFLAGLTTAPTIYSPFGEHPNAWKARQKEVLTRMVSLKYITQKQAEKATKETLHFKRQQTALHAPHFVQYIKNLLAQKYGLALLEKGGLTITTSLDSKLQDQVQNIVKEEVSKNEYLNLTNGAAVVTDPRNGDILAMVGSRDFNDPNGGNVNLVTSMRQPGSSIKVVTYSAALTHGFTAASILEDTPERFVVSDTETYTPVNYDGTYHGRVTLRTALANSLNLPAVKVLKQVSIPSMVTLAENMGVSHWGDPKNYGLSVTLGSAEVTMLDMATVNATLANQGVRIDINPILKITNATGAILEQKRQVPGVRVLAKGVAYIISNILADNQARSMEFGPSSPLNIPGHTVSVKTGTSDNKRDNWTNGYTNNAVVVVWVGNNDNSPMSPSLASGITGAAPIWHRIMSLLLTKTPEKPFPMPDDVIQTNCFGRNEYFLKGTENSAFCGPQLMPTTSGQQNPYKQAPTRKKKEAIQF